MPRLDNLYFDLRSRSFSPTATHQPACTVLLWEIEEEEEELTTLLQQTASPSSNTQTQETLQQLKHPHRRLEILATRCLLALETNGRYDIAYHSNGKPYLRDNSLAKPDIAPLHIGISHSAKVVSVSLSHAPIGIDIEQCSPRAFGIRKRFLSPTEQAQFLINPNDATLLWCAKEAGYKLLNLPNLRFLDDMHLQTDEHEHLCLIIDHPNLSPIAIDSHLLTHTQHPTQLVLAHQHSTTAAWSDQ